MLHTLRSRSQQTYDLPTSQPMLCNFTCCITHRTQPSVSEHPHPEKAVPLTCRKAFLTLTVTRWSDRVHSKTNVHLMTGLDPRLGVSLGYGLSHILDSASLGRWFLRALGFLRLGLWLGRTIVSGVESYAPGTPSGIARSWGLCMRLSHCVALSLLL